jgi:transposase
MTIIRVGLDTSKHVFQVHGVDENEQAVLRRQLRRSAVEKFFAKLAPTRIGIEACGASHHWARRLRGLGHEVLLMPPQYIKAYVKRGKNDAIDAEAICEATSRPTMRFVPVKTVEQQAALVLGLDPRMLGVRDLLIKQRTMLINAIRGHAAEFGITAAKGPKQITELLGRLASDEGVPALAREMLGLLASQLEAVNGKLKAIEARLMAWHRHDQTSQCLATIPGVGPIGGVSFALKSLPSRKRGCRTPRLFARAGTLRRGSASRRARTPPQANTGPARSAARATRICEGCSYSAPPRSSSRPSTATPRRGSWNCWCASRRSSRQWRWPTRWPASSGP